jgi:Dimethylamine methyltransferase (Dimeth_PyL).
MTKITTDNGDGSRIEMSLEEVKKAIADGSAEAAKKAKIDPLDAADAEALLEIFMEPDRMVSVASGSEVVTTDDGSATLIYLDNTNGGLSIPMSPTQAVLTFERVVAADTTSLGHSDYSCRPVKPIIEYVATEYHTTSQMTTAPLYYGFQPNLGLYFQPVGPFPDHFNLMKEGKHKEAAKAQEEAAQAMADDILFAARKLYSVGLEGLNLDTSGSYGDPDLLGALMGCEAVKAEFPDLPVELGFAGEQIIGMNGRMKYKDIRLAGVYPHQQVELAAKAGASIVGLAVNSNTSQSTPWNLARSLTFVKAASRVSTIPIHANVGMGVCGLSMDVTPGIGIVSRCSKAHVEIAKVDGL